MIHDWLNKFHLTQRSTLLQSYCMIGWNNSWGASWCMGYVIWQVGASLEDAVIKTIMASASNDSSSQQHDEQKSSKRLSKGPILKGLSRVANVMYKCVRSESPTAFIRKVMGQVCRDEAKKARVVPPSE